MTGKFPQVLDPVQIIGVSPRFPFSQGMPGWQVQGAQSPMLYYKGSLLPGGGIGQHLD